MPGSMHGGPLFKSSQVCELLFHCYNKTRNKNGATLAYSLGIEFIMAGKAQQRRPRQMTNCARSQKSERDEG